MFKIMGKLKTVLKSLFDRAEILYEKLDSGLRSYIPLAVTTVNAIKKVIDSDSGTIILIILKDACPSDTGDAIIQKIFDWLKQKGLPYLLTSLELEQSILAIDDKEQQLASVLAALNVSKDKSEIYSTIAGMIASDLTDGDISLKNAIKIVKYYYNNVLNK